MHQLLSIHQARQERSTSNNVRTIFLYMLTSASPQDCLDFLQVLDYQLINNLQAVQELALVISESIHLLQSK